MTASEFATSNRMLDSVLEKSKLEGNYFAERYPPIAEEDLEKLRDHSSFNTNDPTEL